MRHVRLDEARCPFCAAPLATQAARAKTGARARALQFTVAAVTLAGCEEKQPNPVYTPQVVHPVESAPATVSDTGSAKADTYSEPPDSSLASAPDSSTEPPHPRPKVTVTVTAKPPPPPPNLNKPYGAPPTDGLLV